MADTILIIEDSPLVQRLVTVALSEFGHEITTAADGPSGVESAFLECPALIVLDIGLPGFDGWEVLRRLRANQLTSSVPVLILTAHAQPENRQLASDGGADGFMSKPFEPATLRSEVARLLTRTRRSLEAI